MRNGCEVKLGYERQYLKPISIPKSYTRLLNIIARNQWQLCVNYHTGRFSIPLITPIENTRRHK